MTDERNGLLEVTPNTEITDSGKELVEEIPPTSGAAKLRRRVSLRDEVYGRLKETAARQGKPITQLVNEVIEAYLNDQQLPS